MSVYIRELARELGLRGHRVDIFTRRHGSGCDWEVQLHENVRLVHLEDGDKGKISKVALYPRLADFFREMEAFRSSEGLQYDLIHGNYWLSGRVGQWAKERWGIPHILVFHTLGAVKNAIVPGHEEPELRIATERYLAAHCDRILASSEREKEHLVQHCGVQADAVGVVPCGVNLDRFRPVEKKQAKDRLGLDPDESVVLYVGRFAALKGIDRLLEAAAHLRRGRKLRLLIVGGDGEQTPESRRLKGLSRSLGIQDVVTFAGRVQHEDMPLYYSTAEVLAVPSHYESFGLVALESLACGTPVVTTQVGAMESIIRQGETGYVVPSASPSLLARAMEVVLSRSVALSAEKLRASVLHWSWSDVASAMIEEYARLLRQDSRELTRNHSSELPVIQTDSLI
jgi:D-inositol-3-phosphate glycosyltransferase